MYEFSPIIKGFPHDKSNSYEIRLFLKFPIKWLSFKSFDGKKEPIDSNTYFFQFENDSYATSFGNKLYQIRHEKLWYVFVDTFTLHYEESQRQKIHYNIILTNDNRSWETSDRCLIDREILAYKVTFSQAKDIIDTFISEKLSVSFDT